MNTESFKKIKALFGENKRSENNNDIYNDVIIGKDVKMGKGNLILPGTIILGNVEIGDNNIIGPKVAIGMPPQHVKYYRESIETDCKIKIGSRNVLREFVTIHSPTSRDTKIGDDCFLMANSHVSHDTHIGNNVVMGNSAAAGGFATIMDHAFIGLNCAVHQFSTIGAHAMIGMNATITKDVPPFLVFHDKYGCYKVNEIGLLRNNFTKEDVKNIYNFYNNESGATNIEQFKKAIDEFRKTSKRTQAEIKFRIKPSE